MNFAISAAGTVPLAIATQPATASAAEHRKLTDAAQQFEGMLLQEMLKPMKEHGFCQKRAMRATMQEEAAALAIP